MRNRLLDLFPPVRPLPVTPVRVAAVLVVLVVGTGLSLLRQAGVPAADTLWAEDGKEFLADAVADGPFAVVFRPYNYFHLAPRLVAMLAMAFPVGWAALVFAVAGAALVAGAAVFVFVASRGLIPSRWVRGVLGAWFLLLPTAGLETMNQVTNLHWYLFVVAFWAVLWRPQSWSGRAVGVVVVVLAGLSNPITLLLAPIAIARIVVDVPVVDRIVPVVLLILGSIQAVVMLGPGSAAAGERPRLGALVEVTANRFAGGTLFGYEIHARLFRTFGMWVAAFAVAVLLAFLVAALRSWSQPQGLLAAYALLLAPVLFAAVVFTRGSVVPLRWAAEHQGIAGARYTVAPALLVASAAALVVAVSRVRPVVWSALFAVLAVVVVVDFRPVNDRSAGPRWSQEVASATARCQQVDGPDAVQLQYPPGWDLRIPCSWLG